MGSLNGKATRNVRGRAVDYNEHGLIYKHKSISVSVSIKIESATLLEDIATRPLTRSDRPEVGKKVAATLKSINGDDTGTTIKDGSSYFI